MLRVTVTIFLFLSASMHGTSVGQYGGGARVPSDQYESQTVSTELLPPESTFGNEPEINLECESASIACVDCAEFEPSAKVSGVFQLDMGYYTQDSTNQLTLGDINDSLGFRRARLAAKGNVTEDMSYIIEFDFAQSQARFVDVWMQANKTRFGNVRIGRFRQPFGMSELTSVRELPFLERPLTFTLRQFRQTGEYLTSKPMGHSGESNLPAQCRGIVRVRVPGNSQVEFPTSI